MGDVLKFDWKRLAERGRTNPPEGWEPEDEGALRIDYRASFIFDAVCRIGPATSAIQWRRIAKDFRETFSTEPTQAIAARARLEGYGLIHATPRVSERAWGRGMVLTQKGVEWAVGTAAISVAGGGVTPDALPRWIRNLIERRSS